MSKKLQKVVSLTTSITTIVWLSGAAALAPMAAMAATINEGDTIKTADNPDVYIAKYVGTKSFKRLILNPDVFNSYKHLSWSAIKTVTQAEMDAFTTSELVRADGDYKVYKLTPNGDVGTKQWVNMTAEEFVAAAYDWDSIYIINSVDRDNYTAGADVTTTAATTSPAATTAAGALSVALASDTPAAGVAVENAAQVPYTKISLTAGAEEVTVTAVTMQRTGLGEDAAVSSVVLLDDATGLQLGLSQTLNANHQATITETFKIPANTTKTYTLAANMPTSLDAYAGQLVSLSLVSVTTTATVSGTLPLTGNAQTMNATLAIGSATITVGSLDPISAATKEVGTTNYAFSALKLTAGSTEDVTVSSIKWNQSGSAASSDLANMVVSDGTTSYATTVSSDGKYYTASFGTAGLTIAKGLSKEFTVKGDIANGSNRTVAFDIYKNTDIVVKGNLYGYKMTPSFTSNGVTHATANATAVAAAASPYFAGSHVTIGTGSLRIDKSSTGAPTANITKGATGQLLGAFDFVVKGESVNVASIIVDFDHTGIGSTSDITSVTLTKADGTVLAGPVNGADVTSPTAHASTLDGARDGYASFSGTITFPVGTTQVLVKGNLNTDFASNDTFRVGFTDASTRVSSITGVTTGNSITATPASAIWGNTMTVKAGALTISVSGTPVAQTVIRGITGYTFANFVFDASASGEDVKVTSAAVQQIVDAAANDNAVTNMQLWDGSTALNTGGNIQDPDGGAATNSYTFTLDNPLVVTKGSQKSVALKGNIIPTATAAGTQRWGLASAAAVSVTGVSTGSDISESVVAANGQLMTIAASGQYSVAADASTPTGKLIAANTTGNIMTVLRFKATAEQINVTKMRLALTSGSSTGIDLAAVYIYDGSALLGSGAFGNYAGALGNASTTFTLSTPLEIAANEEKVVTIKADIAPIHTTNTVATAGHTPIINYYGSTSTSENIGTGQSSGAEIANYSSTTSQAAAYIYRSIPTVAVTQSANTFTSAGIKTISKFSVKADEKGDIDLYKFTFYLSTSSSVGLANLTLVDTTGGTETTLHASTTAYYVDVYGNRADVVLYASPGTISGGTITPRTVAANNTRTFELRANVSYTGTANSFGVDAYLAGDGAETAKASGTYGLTAANVDADGNDDFIWSDWSDADHSTSAAGSNTTDWYNGYLVSGLSSTY